MRRLREAIDNSGMSRREISIKAGFDPSYVHQIYNSRNTPNLDRLLRLCEVLNVSAVAIITGLDQSADEEALLKLFAKLSKEDKELAIKLVQKLG